MPQGLYLPEGTIIGTAQNKYYTGSEAAMKQAMESGAIVEGIVTRCDQDHNLYCDIGEFKGIIYRKEAVIDVETVRNKEIAVISKVGKPVCFKVTGQEDGLYILSRRAAQQEALDYFMTNLSLGDIVKGKVTHIEPFGVFVDMGCGNISLIGIENISVSRISSPSERFYPGQQIYGAVRIIDREHNRITLTHKELLGTWMENASRFRAGETVRGIVRGVEEYGIFVELAPNLSGLSEFRGDVSPGMAVSVYIKSILPERMKIKLMIIDVLENNAKQHITLSDYFIKEGRICQFCYTPEQCEGKRIETKFE